MRPLAWPTHAGLRQILATYLGVEYASVDVCHDADGKPYVDGGPPFSLSDSGDLALIAVGNDVPIGVDIEQIRADRPVEGFAQRFFSPYEREALRPLSGEELVEAFYWCWTAKEAYLRALGVGLRRSLDSFDISSRLLVPVDSMPTGGRRWLCGYARRGCGQLVKCARCTLPRTP
jgi:4'-phosphopantetheinyl transferase